MSKRGYFITFEGGEGCGKSTQAGRFEARLKAAGYSVLRLREPGGTRVGELVREMLLDPGNSTMDPRAELLLYEASRAQLVAEQIVPALEAGEIVVCDRFYDSTTAYQGYGRGLSLDDIDALNEIATGGLRPDLTILIDVEPALGISRATQHGADRLESEDIAFHRAVRDGFLAIATSEPDRVAVVDGNGTPDEVEARVLDAARTLPELARVLGGAS